MHVAKWVFARRPVTRRAIVTLRLAAPVIAMALTLPACSESSTFYAMQTPPKVEGKVRLLVIGNSITRHSPSKEKQWDHDAGMAAPDTAHDYAHLFARSLGLDTAVHVRNFYPFETEPGAADQLIASLKPALARKPEIVVVQLGDNVKQYRLDQLWSFSGTYRKLLAAVKPGRRLYCVSTFWSHSLTDGVIERACNEAGGHYVYIGDIYDAPGNPDRAKVDYANAGVDKHPKRYGMAQIAAHLTAAARKDGVALRPAASFATANAGRDRSGVQPPN